MLHHRVSTKWWINNSVMNSRRLEVWCETDCFSQNGTRKSWRFTLNLSRWNSGSCTQFGSMLFLGFQVLSAILVSNSSIICNWIQNGGTPPLLINKQINKLTSLKLIKANDYKKGIWSEDFNKSSRYFVFHSSVSFFRFDHGSLLFKIFFFQFICISVRKKSSNFLIPQSLNLSAALSFSFL